MIHSYFYPRSPCGERRPASRRDGANGADFYPRSPCGERHQLCEQAAIAAFISIHALLAESDLLAGYRRLVKQEFLSTLSLRRATVYLALIRYLINFYPRSPCGERPFMASPMRMIVGFLSTLSLRRATRGWTLFVNGAIFLSTLSLRRATCAAVGIKQIIVFLSTLSLRRATAGPRIPLGGLEISIHALLAESDANQTNLPG